MFLMLFNLDFDSPSVILKMWLKNGVTGRKIITITDGY